MPLIGDVIKDVTTKLGIKSCIPCQKRQAAMNQAQTDFFQKIKDTLAKLSSGSSGSGPSPGV